MSKLTELLFPGVLVFLASCQGEKELKNISWGEKQISLAMSDGGATTGYFWNIYVISDGLIYKDEDLIFSSYSLPYVDDIELANDTLNIICSSGVIDIPLTDLDKFIDDPVRYNRNNLESTNETYREPQFIKDERKLIENN